MIKNKKVVIIIPARYDSTRFPGKPLALINNKPMIQWVYERVAKVNVIDDVYVATDDKRIYNKANEFGGKAIMTSDEHESGTDRIIEAVTKINTDIDIVLNIQGDEPLIKAEMICDLVSAFDNNEVYMATLKKKIINEEEIYNKNVVKVIDDINNNAIYFSRNTIPYNRNEDEDVIYYKHIGVYGYKKSFLLNEFQNLPNSRLESIEKLEQLRVIENGYKINVVETKYNSIGVDVPEQIKLVEKEMSKEGIV